MGRVIKAAYEELFLVVGISVAWWVGTLLVVTAPMTTAGVHNVANRIANYKRSGFDLFWEGARSYIGLSLIHISPLRCAFSLRDLCAPLCASALNPVVE